MVDAFHLLIAHGYFLPVACVALMPLMLAASEMMDTKTKAIMVGTWESWKFTKAIQMLAPSSCLPACVLHATSMHLRVHRVPRFKVRLHVGRPQEVADHATLSNPLRTAM